MPAVAKARKQPGTPSSCNTVRFRDGRTATRTVRAIEKDQYVFKWGLDLLRYYDQNLVLRRQTTPEDGKEVPSYLVSQQTLPFPLSVNKSWQFRYETRQGRHFIEERQGGLIGISYEYRVFRYKVLGAETIQTPAGAFGAFKIEERSDEIECQGLYGRCEDRNVAPTVRHLWYAPEVKSVVKLLRVSGEFWQGQEPDYELAAFELK